jgi:FkbM family methyltransferase
VTRSSLRAVKRLVPRSLVREIRGRLDRESAELKRLRKVPWGTPGVTRILGKPLSYPDARMFAVTYEPIFRRGIYRFSPREAAPRILDCGANIGLASIYWKRKFPTARITAFEPDPATVEFLRMNLASNDAADVLVVQAAVWTHGRGISLSRPDTDAGGLGSRIVETRSTRSTTDSVQVPTVRLRDYLLEPVDFLKVDIEGAETDVILDVADQLPDVGNLFVEYHGFSGRSRLKELLDAIESGGFSVYIEQEQPSVDSPFVERRDNNGMDVQLNLYCYRPDPQAAQ